MGNFVLVLTFSIFVSAAADGIVFNIDNMSASNNTADFIVVSPTPKPILNRYSLEPMAAGGIGLLSGMIIITAVVGVFIFITKRRHDQFVYEPALTSDLAQHI